MLNKLSDNLHVLQSINTVVDENQIVLYPTEFLSSIEMSGLPQHELHLKKNAVIILMRNLDVKNGHCNGTRYIVLDISSELLTVR